MNAFLAFLKPRLTRANVATLLMLGGGVIVTIQSAVCLWLLAYQPMPGPESAAVSRTDGIAKLGLAFAGAEIAVLLVMGLIVLNIDRVSGSVGMASFSIDRDDGEDEQEGRRSGRRGEDC